jgi:RimJ/RimL family protein N-acetyltransferase
VNLRAVRKKDWDFILQLRNEEDYRKNFYEQHNISKKEHYGYLKKQTLNPNFHNWIIQYDQKDAGYVRILDNDISIIIDKKYHNKGIGSSTLQLIETEAKRLGIKKLIGRVMTPNKSSKKIFEKNGYKLLMYWLEKDIS